MSTTNTGGVLANLSDELSNAVQRASQAIVTVDARRQLAASGILWPAGNGIVVTSDHVVERDEDITVKLADGRKFGATVAGRDPGSDIAVLRLSLSDGATAPAPAELAPIDSVKIGHVALAVGRPGDGATMATFGIVSATGGSWRTARGGNVDGYVRADVTLYPGFSGGPLVDTSGRVIGMNSWHIANGQELAIPAAAISATVQTLLTSGSIKRAYLGVTSQPAALPESLRQKLGVTQATGLVIIGVEAGSPADKSGLVLGDVLVTFGGQAIADPGDLQSALGSARVGAPVAATIVRGGERKDMTLTPGERA